MVDVHARVSEKLCDYFWHIHVTGQIQSSVAPIVCDVDVHRWMLQQLVDDGLVSIA